MASQRSRMRRLSALLGMAALVAACSSGGQSAAPGGESPAASVAPPAGESPAGSAPAGSAPAGSPAAGGSFACENIGGEVSVVGSWTGAEQDSFRAMIAPWEECSGATVNYTGSRDLAAQLTTGIASGTLPDVAGLPGPGLMKEWYDQGALKPLDFVNFDEYAANTPPGFADAGKAADGKLLGIFTKAAVKGLIYYTTKASGRATPRRRGTTSRSRRAVRAHRRRKSLVHRRRVRRGIRLAGHRLDRGHPASPGRPRRLRRLGQRARRSGPRRKSRPHSRRSARPSRTLRRLELHRDDELRPGREPDVRGSARLPVPPPGVVHHRLLQERGRGGGRRLRLLRHARHRAPPTPARSRPPATCSGCSTTRRRRSRSSSTC